MKRRILIVLMLALTASVSAICFQSCGKGSNSVIYGGTQ